MGRTVLAGTVGGQGPTEAEVGAAIAAQENETLFDLTKVKVLVRLGGGYPSLEVLRCGSICIDVTAGKVLLVNRSE